MVLGESRGRPVDDGVESKKIKTVAGLDLCGRGISFDINDLPGGPAFTFWPGLSINSR